MTSPIAPRKRHTTPVVTRVTCSAVAVLAFGITALVPASCTVESGGSGSYIRGEINAPDCWSGPFDLNPDYFAAVPYAFDDSLQIRIQNGGDFQTFSDGVFILIEKLQAARKQLKASTTSPPSLTMTVSLPPEVTPPGVPITPTSNPSRVHMRLYLQRSCRTQNVALYALDEVSMGPNGECTGDRAPQIACPQGGTGALGDAGTSGDAAADGDAAAGGDAARTTIGRSTMTFYRLFSGDLDERSADERFTKAKFDVYLADPRDACPGGVGPPPPCRGHLQGEFDFYFQRGRPAQPFP